MSQLANRALFVVSITALSATVYAAMTLPHTFTAGQPAKAAEVNANFKALADRLDELEAVMKITEVEGKKAVVFNGVNVHIRNGAGKTSSTNGLGNLVVGYNEKSKRAVCDKPEALTQFNCQGKGHKWGVNQRTGSHNLVVGYGHDYTNYGSTVLGSQNLANGAYATVSGLHNHSYGRYSNVSGGGYNQALGHASSILGGGGMDISDKDPKKHYAGGNKAYGSYSTIAGGWLNKAGEADKISAIKAGRFASVSGGGRNQATGWASTVSGGLDGIASGIDSTVSGGNGAKANTNQSHMP